jgi:biopolymer transport protein ExbD
MKPLLPLLAVLILSACTHADKTVTVETPKAEETPTEYQPPKYVYVDCNGTLHLKRDCMAKPSNDSLLVGSFAPVAIIAIDTLKRTDYKLICPVCIEDEQYDTILNRIANKTGTKIKTKTQL